MNLKGLKFESSRAPSWFRLSLRFGVTIPGDFFRTREGVGLFQHAHNNSLVTSDNPARAGEVVVAYLTGLPEALTAERA